jgi:hypothetical protein
MSLYISPNSSFEGGTPIGAAAAVPVAQNARPQLNEGLLDIRQEYPSRIPAGTFTEYGGAPVNSKPFFANPPFFSNAKAASMLERGLKRFIYSRLSPGDQGLLVENDGPSTEVKVVRNPPDISGNNNYTFLTVNPIPQKGELIFAPARGIFHEWDFYTHTAPVPFVPRAGSLARASAAASARPDGGGGSGGSGGSGGRHKKKRTHKNKRSKKTRRRSKSK